MCQCLKITYSARMMHSKLLVCEQKRRGCHILELVPTMLFEPLTPSFMFLTPSSASVDR